jgi:hypothetical protein
MTNVNLFDNWKARASMVGNLMTQPQSKAAKDNNELSETAKKYLYEEYARFVWGKEPLDVTTKQMAKGNTAEEDSLLLLSTIDGIIYEKNEQKVSNDYLIGTPDVICREPLAIKDVKTSWDSKTFISKHYEGLSNLYYYQLLAYLEITGAKTGEVVFCLVDTPEELIQDELYRAAKRQNCIELPPPKEAAIRNSMTFEDIPQEQRIIRFQVDYNEEVIHKIRQKIDKCREFLHTIHTKVTK